MGDSLIDLLTESSVALGEMIGDPNVPVSYSPHLMAAKTRIRRASEAIERLKAALDDLRSRSVEEGIHHFVKRIDLALLASPAGMEQAADAAWLQAHGVQLNPARGEKGWQSGDRVAVKQTLAPFAREPTDQSRADHREHYAGSQLTVGDFRRAKAVFDQLFPAAPPPAPHSSTQCTKD